MRTFCDRCGCEDPVGGVEQLHPNKLMDGGMPPPFWCFVCRNMVTAWRGAPPDQSVDLAMAVNILRKDIAGLPAVKDDAGVEEDNRSFGSVLHAGAVRQGWNELTAGNLLLRFLEDERQAGRVPTPASLEDFLEGIITLENEES